MVKVTYDILFVFSHLRSSSAISYVWRQATRLQKAFIHGIDQLTVPWWPELDRCKLNLFILEHAFNLVHGKIALNQLVIRMIDPVFFFFKSPLVLKTWPCLWKIQEITCTTLMGLMETCMVGHTLTWVADTQVITTCNFTVMGASTGLFQDLD